jgi:hypothetical protein
MNDLSMPVRSTDRTEQEILQAVVEPGVRISPLDRLSLRLGLWLLLRSSRRTRRARDHADHVRLLAALRARQEREHVDAWNRFDGNRFL